MRLNFAFVAMAIYFNLQSDVRLNPTGVDSRKDNSATLTPTATFNFQFRVAALDANALIGLRVWESCSNCRTNGSSLHQNVLILVPGSVVSSERHTIQRVSEPSWWERDSGGNGTVRTK
jgi:hypothetical protein